MAKFAVPTRPNVLSPISSVSTRLPDTSTYEGGAGFTRDAKSELFLLSVTNFVREQSFYESADDRDDRFENLVHKVTAEDPEWMQKFIPWLRNDANMRSASIVAAAEYVKAGGRNARQVVSGALRRADEPAEMIAYWLQRHGRKIPMPVKRGVADGVVRLYNERSALKWDGQGKEWRFADVIELVHPSPQTDSQSVLFKHLIDRRHGRDVMPSPDTLPTMYADMVLRNCQADERRSMIGGHSWDQAAWTWERLSGWLPGGMDAEAWEAAIPHMGVFALVRNLRNFDQAGVGRDAIARVQAKITNPEDIKASRMFPMRFLSAYKAVESERWKPALEEAVNLSMENVPALGGKSLILVDVSYSMVSRFSERSELQRWEAAALFGAALATRADRADLYAYSSWDGNLDIRTGNARHSQIAFGAGASVFTILKRIREAPAFGGGTETWQTVHETFSGHDRVVILTDEQAFAGSGDPGERVIPLIETFNLAGYVAGHGRSGDRGRHTFGGLSDQSFAAIPMIEGFDAGRWPWE